MEGGTQGRSLLDPKEGLLLGHDALSECDSPSGLI